jgi:flagellar hook-basal body complex protein FliE
MNPLSALPSMVPGTGPVQMPAFARPIPAAELEKLGSTGGLPGISTGSNPGSFSGLLEKFVNDVNNKQVAAGQAVHDLQNGQSVSLHQTMIAMEEASISFHLMVEVRNKVLESYQELMRMQI